MGVFEGNPCHGCEKRHIECHADCPDYAEWLEKYKSFKKKYIKEQADDLLVGDFMNENRRKRVKKVHKDRWR